MAAYNAHCIYMEAGGGGMPSPLHIFDGRKPSNVLVNNAENYDPGIILSELKAKKSGRFIIGHININFLDKKIQIPCLPI